MKKMLLLVLLFSIGMSTSCARIKPSELQNAVVSCKYGGKECFENLLGPARETGWTASGAYYMRWEGKGLSSSANPYAPYHLGGGGLEPIPCTLEINLRGKELIGWKLTGPCKDDELRY